MKDSFDAINSGDPIDEELLRYALDGEPLSKAARSRIEHDSATQQRLMRLMRVHDALTSTLYRSQCPSSLQLSDYCAPESLHLLRVDERMHLAQHISFCPLCTAEVAAIRHELMANNLFSDEQMAGATSIAPQSLIRRLVAVLQPPQPQFATRNGNILGTRGTQSQAGWPKHYKAETLDLSLHLSHASNGDLMLLGLFTSTDPDESIDAFDGSPAELYDAENVPSPQTNGEQAQQSQETQVSPLLRTSVDDLGNLVFKPVPAGMYTMLVHLPERELLIEGIDIDHVK